MEVQLVGQQNGHQGHHDGRQHHNKHNVHSLKVITGGDLWKYRGTISEMNTVSRSSLEEEG